MVTTRKANGIEKPNRRYLSPSSPKRKNTDQFFENSNPIVEADVSREPFQVPNSHEPRESESARTTSGKKPRSGAKQKTKPKIKSKKPSAAFPTTSSQGSHRESKQTTSQTTSTGGELAVALVSKSQVIRFEVQEHPTNNSSEGGKLEAAREGPSEMPQTEGGSKDNTTSKARGKASLTRITGAARSDKLQNAQKALAAGVGPSKERVGKEAHVGSHATGVNIPNVSNLAKGEHLKASNAAAKQADTASKTVKKAAVGKARSDTGANGHAQEAINERPKPETNVIDRKPLPQKGVKRKATATNSKVKEIRQPEGQSPKRNAATKFSAAILKSTKRGRGRPRKKAQVPGAEGQPREEKGDNNDPENAWNEPSPVSDSYATVHPEQKKTKRNQVKWLEEYTNSLLPLAKRGRPRTPELASVEEGKSKKVNLSTITGENEPEEDEDEVSQNTISRRYEWVHTRSPPKEKVLPKRKGRKPKSKSPPVHETTSHPLTQEKSPRSRIVAQYSTRPRLNQQSKPKRSSLRTSSTPSYSPLTPPTSNVRSEPTGRWPVHHQAPRTDLVVDDEDKRTTHRERRRHSVSFEDPSQQLLAEASAQLGLGIQLPLEPPPIVTSSRNRALLDEEATNEEISNTNSPLKRTRRSSSMTLFPPTSKPRSRKRPYAIYEDNDENGRPKPISELDMTTPPGSTDNQPRKRRRLSTPFNPLTPGPRGSAVPESPSPGYLQRLWDGVRAVGARVVWGPQEFEAQAAAKRRLAEEQWDERVTKRARKKRQRNAERRRRELKPFLAQTRMEAATLEVVGDGDGGDAEAAENSRRKRKLGGDLEETVEDSDGERSKKRERRETSIAAEESVEDGEEDEESEHDPPEKVNKGKARATVADLTRWERAVDEDDGILFSDESETDEEFEEEVRKLTPEQRRLFEAAKEAVEIEVRPRF